MQQAGSLCSPDYRAFARSQDATKSSASPATNRGQQEDEARSGAPTVVMPRWKKHCPKSVCSFVVLMKNEINNLKYEHGDDDSGKTRESSWLLQGRTPRGRDSGLDCSERDPGAAAEVSSVSCRLSDDGNRNQYFCCGGHESASVPRCLVR